MQWEAENKSRGLNQIKITESIKRKRLYKEILKDCKTWSRPYTSEKLIKTKKLRPEKENFNVKTEMAQSAHTHYPDKLQQPELYKLNGISFEEKLEKLLPLLSVDSEQSAATIANLLNNQDVIQSINNFHHLKKQIGLEI